MNYEFIQQELTRQKKVLKEVICDLEANLKPISHISKGRLSVDISELRNIWQNLLILEDNFSQLSKEISDCEFDEVIKNRGSIY